jgi:oligoribonuclease NrnB/cAMP/cGMP phosphodiesterase (DHH superfamily)
MEELLKITTNVIWIDHHISAINKYKDFNHEIKGIRFDGIAASLLTYLYFSQFSITLSELESYNEINNYRSRGKTREEYVKTIKENAKKYADYYIFLTSDWDTFDLTEGTTTLNFIDSFNLGFNEEKITPLSDEAFENMREHIHTFIERGRYVTEYKKQSSKSLSNKKGFEINLLGYRTYCVNTSNKSSLTFSDLENKQDYEVFLVFLFTGNSWEYSVYTEKNYVDCSKIAQKFGGGGHRQASGFITKESIFNDYPPLEK